MLLHWYDQRQGIGGWHRIGHEPNNKAAARPLWSYMFDRAGLAISPLRRFVLAETIAYRTASVPALH